MIQLHEHPLSPYAQKVKIALRHKDIPFELLRPEGLGSGAAAEAFAHGNPRREVPLLVDGDCRIFDSTIMLDYLEEKHPETALMPDSPAARARVRMIEDVADTHLEAVNWGLGEIRYFRRAEGDKADALRGQAEAQLDGFFAWLESQLDDAEWMTGAQFGRADLAVVPFLNASRGFGFAPQAGGALAGWLDRVNSVPAVATTAAEAEASIASIGKAYRAVESGAFRRHYRDHRLEWMIRSGGFDIVARGLERGDIRFTDGFDGGKD